MIANQSIVSLIEVGKRNLYSKKTSKNVENGKNNKTQMSIVRLECFVVLFYMKQQVYKLNI